MKKYLLIISIAILGTSCGVFKKQVEEPVQAKVVEEVVEEKAVIPDFVTTDLSDQSDCREDWGRRERQILQRDEDRIGKLGDATEGQIFVVAKVNRSGYVTDVHIDKKNTTVKKEIWLNMAMELVSEYIFEPITEGPKYDCGTVKFYLTSK